METNTEMSFRAGRGLFNGPCTGTTSPDLPQVYSVNSGGAFLFLTEKNT